MHPLPHPLGPWTVRHIQTALDLHRYVGHEGRILRAWKDRGQISAVYSLKVGSPSDIAAALSTPVPPGCLDLWTLHGWADDEGVLIGPKGGKVADYFDLADLPTASSRSAAILFTGCQGTEPHHGPGRRSSGSSPRRSP